MNRSRRAVDSPWQSCFNGPPFAEVLLDWASRGFRRARVRRARNKHVKNYRRRAALEVEEQAGRGTSRPKNARAAQRAEIFEDALARVSGRLEVLARRSAEELKAARLAAARKGSTGPGAAKPAADSGPGKGRARAHRKSTGGLKRDASSRSKGARRQAARDSR